MKKQEVFNRMKPRKCEICNRDCFNYKSYTSHRASKHKNRIKTSLKPVTGTITFTAYRDKVNGWKLPEDKLIFGTYGYPDLTTFGSIDIFSRSGKQFKYSDLCLRIYKRKLYGTGSYYICYSFVLGLWQEDTQAWLPIDGFNLTEDQVKDILT